jgi:hypothetical protein
VVSAPYFRVAVLAMGAASACKPNLDDTVSIVTTPRLLAVQSENDAGEAEFSAGATFGMTALYVGSRGDVAPSPLKWAFCNEPKPLAELGPVSPLCLDVTGSWLDPLGVGDRVEGMMPATACQNFGPEAVTPQQRPVDPDPTGGYYQPVQLLAPGEGTTPMISIGETRINCTLASPSADVRAAFKMQYVRNRNPAVESLQVRGGTGPWLPASSPGGQPNHVQPGEHVDLEVAWPVCSPPTAVDGGSTGAYAPCEGAEHYLLLDTASQTLVDQREAIAVAWYATGGVFDVDRSGRAGDDPLTTSDNGWRAPEASGPVIMWLVLRDERGGVGWQKYDVDVH